LLRRLGRSDEARQEYAKAIADFEDSPERRLLEQRMAELEAS
jgi:predicted RNA polymerase sigma factor